MLAIWGIRPPNETFVNTDSGLAPCRLRRGRVQSKAITCSSSQRGNVHCALDSHLHQTVDRRLCSVTPPPLRRLDKTGYYLSYAGDADRPCQKQDRTRGRKRTPPSATRYSSSTGETTHLYQNGPDALGSSGEGRAEPGKMLCSLSGMMTFSRW